MSQQNERSPQMMEICDESPKVSTEQNQEFNMKDSFRLVLLFYVSMKSGYIMCICYNSAIIIRTMVSLVKKELQTLMQRNLFLYPVIFVVLMRYAY